MTETFDLNELQTGAWVASGEGHYGSAGVIEVACSLGWEDAEAEALAAGYRETNGYCTDDSEADSIKIEMTYEAASEAEEWLNENRCAENHTWTWWEGEFGYYDSEFMEEFGDW